MRRAVALYRRLSCRAAQNFNNSWPFTPGEGDLQDFLIIEAIFNRRAPASASSTTLDTVRGAAPTDLLLFRLRLARLLAAPHAGVLAAALDRAVRLRELAFADIQRVVVDHILGDIIDVAIGIAPRAARR